jgi:lipopolysaccharide transport system ATP-binding protein
MSSDTIITVENIGKRYRLGAQKNERYTALRDVIAEKARSLFRNPQSAVRNGSEADASEFWALKDVSFEVKRGEVVGIIGRNGAGKSTLLKILSRITEPTEGKVRIKGRVASLLEVGTGFHPELTGRENIYLNGAILGMRRNEIKKKFDEIVAFAETEKFLDTPVKRYSSGMYVRLAFAVAAHLEPEILIVDEVLAVGDSQFQKKCLGKMHDVAKGGRTVLFVSHNMNAVESLCNSAILMHQGRLVRRGGNVRDLVGSYLQDSTSKDAGTQWIPQTAKLDNPYFQPVRLGLYDNEGRLIVTDHPNNQDAWVEIEANIKQLEPALTIGYDLYTSDGIHLYRTYQTDVAESEWPSLKEETVILRSKLPRFLNEGTYRLEIVGGLHCRGWLFEPGKDLPAIRFSIRGGLSESPYWLWQRSGLLGPIIPWEIA